MKRILTCIFAAVLIAFSLVGCAAKKSAAQPEATPSPEPTLAPLYKPAKQNGVADSGDIKIGLCVLDEGEETDAKRVAGFKETCEASGTAYEVLDAGGSTQQQIKNIRAMQTTGCNVIVVGQGEEEKLVDVCREVLEAGIQLITITHIPGVEPNVVIDPQNFLLSYRLGAVFAQLGRGNCQAAILYDPEESWVTQQRLEGYRYYVDHNENDAVIDIVSEIPAGDASEAAQAALELWEQYPDAQIWCTHAQALMGASEAAQERGVTSVVGGAEMNAETLELLGQNKIQAVSAQFPYAQGQAASEAATAIALGQAYPSVVNNTFRTYNYKEYDVALANYMES